METNDMVNEVLARIEYSIEQQESLIREQRILMSSNGMDRPGDYYKELAIKKAEAIIAGLRMAKAHLVEVHGAP